MTLCGGFPQALLPCILSSSSPLVTNLSGLGVTFKCQVHGQPHSSTCLLASASRCWLMFSWLSLSHFPPLSLKLSSSGGSPVHCAFPVASPGPSLKGFFHLLSSVEVFVQAALTLMVTWSLMVSSQASEDSMWTWTAFSPSKGIVRLAPILTQSCCGKHV